MAGFTLGVGGQHKSYSMFLYFFSRVGIIFAFFFQRENMRLGGKESGKELGEGKHDQKTLHEILK